MEFTPKRGLKIFPIKKEGLLFKKEVSLIFILILFKLIPNIIFPGGFVVCVLFIYTLSVFFVFNGKNFVLLNLINRYVTSASE